MSIFMNPSEEDEAPTLSLAHLEAQVEELERMAPKPEARTWGGPRAPRPSARKRRRLQVRASRKANR